MAEDLLKELSEAHRQVALRSRGSIKKAQTLAKKLRKNGLKNEATLLIRKSNEAAAFMPKEYW
jgi:hypothetical protein